MFASIKRKRQKAAGKKARRNRSRATRGLRFEGLERREMLDGGWATGFRVSWGDSEQVPIQKSDFDGDGRADIAVYRPRDGAWSIATSSNNFRPTFSVLWGDSEQTPLQNCDFDGDGRTDIAVYRPRDGAWSVLTSSSNFTGGFAKWWGGLGEIPIPTSDYDGDGCTDLTVFRPSDGTWRTLFSSENVQKITITAAGGVLTVTGSDESDRILLRQANGFISVDGVAGSYRIGGISRIIVVAGDGDDLVTIRQGVLPATTIHGGRGNDVVYGGSANDEIFGEDGKDFLFGGPGADRLLGGYGDDVLMGGPGNDYLFGGGGNDTLVGGSGSDTLIGDEGADTLVERGVLQDDWTTEHAIVMDGDDLNVLNGGPDDEGDDIWWNGDEANPQSVALENDFGDRISDIADTVANVVVAIGEKLLRLASVPLSFANLTPLGAAVALKAVHGDRWDDVVKEYYEFALPVALTVLSGGELAPALAPSLAASLGVSEALATGMITAASSFAIEGGTAALFGGDFNALSAAAKSLLAGTFAYLRTPGTTPDSALQGAYDPAKYHLSDVDPSEWLKPPLTFPSWSGPLRVSDGILVADAEVLKKAGLTAYSMADSTVGLIKNGTSLTRLFVYAASRVGNASSWAGYVGNNANLACFGAIVSFSADMTGLVLTAATPAGPVVLIIQGVSATDSFIDIFKYCVPPASP